MKTPILRGPNWTLRFHIHIVSQSKEIQVDLGQLEGKIPYEIYFISKNPSKVELNYIVIEK